MGFAPTWLGQVSPLLHKTTLTTASVQISNITKVCVQSLPCARMQARRRRRHCLIVSSINTSPGGMFPIFDETSLQLVNVMNPAAIHAPAASPKSGWLGTSAMIFFTRCPFSSCLQF